MDEMDETTNITPDETATEDFEEGAEDPAGPKTPKHVDEDTDDDGAPD